jgi:hypothetical protein
VPQFSYSQTHPPTSTTLQAAVSYLERGWHLLPVIPAGKLPASHLLVATRSTRRWGSLLTDPASRAEVERWYRLQPDANVGLLCTNGLAVIDVDDTTAVLPEVPPTLTASTPSGGRHHYLHAAKPVRGRTFPWGELRAGGLYVVAPPSVGENGNAYRWQRQSPLAELDETPLGTVRRVPPTGYTGFPWFARFSW